MGGYWNTFEIPHCENWEIRWKLDVIPEFEQNGEGESELTNVNIMIKCLTVPAFPAFELIGTILKSKLKSATTTNGGCTK